MVTGVTQVSHGCGRLSLCACVHVICVHCVCMCMCAPHVEGHIWEWWQCVRPCHQAAVCECSPWARSPRATAGSPTPSCSQGKAAGRVLGAAMGSLPAAPTPTGATLTSTVLRQRDRVQLPELHQRHPGCDGVVRPAGHQHLLAGAAQGAGEDGLPWRAADPGLPVRGGALQLQVSGPPAWLGHCPAVRTVTFRASMPSVVLPKDIQSELQEHLKK